MPAKRISKFTHHRLDGDFLVMEVYLYNDDECRVEVVFQPSGAPSAINTTVMVQRRTSLELAIAAIARDFTTFAARALAILPTVGRLDDGDGSDEDSP